MGSNARTTFGLAAYALAGIAAYLRAFGAFHTIVVGVWFALALALQSSGSLRKLDARERRLFWLAVLAFPVWEFGIKWMILKNVIPYSWFWLNRLEHWAWMTATVLLLYPTFRNAWRPLPFGVQLVFVLGLACLVGNLNEFWEFGVRAAWGNVSKGAYYWDTIGDMLVNVGGGITGFLLLRAARARVLISAPR